MLRKLETGKSFTGRYFGDCRVTLFSLDSFGISLVRYVCWVN